MSEPELYPLGTRVRINDHGGFPDGLTGTIAEVPQFVRMMRDYKDPSPLYYEEKRPKGHAVIQGVEFDEPTDDGSGDGPYRATGVPLDHLQAL